jgi:hypothetical protein
MPCYRCGRVQTDPVKGASPWAVAVAAGEQVLVCPSCQSEPAWDQPLEHCNACGSRRLKIVMGSILCRDCGSERATFRA